MTRDEILRIISEARKTGGRIDLHGVDLHGVDLTDVNLYEANLYEANLTGANLAEANLFRANLRRADLTGANLHGADLTGAVLTGANLRGADMRGADLRGANLTGANLDFSCWPLWCGSNGVKVDARIAAQLAAHFCALDCDDPAYKAARHAVLAFANTSHRAGDLGVEEK